MQQLKGIRNKWGERKKERKKKNMLAQKTNYSDIFGNGRKIHSSYARFVSSDKSH